MTITVLVCQVIGTSTLSPIVVELLEYYQENFHAKLTCFTVEVTYFSLKWVVR